MVGARPAGQQTRHAAARRDEGCYAASIQGLKAKKVPLFQAIDYLPF